MIICQFIKGITFRDILCLGRGCGLIVAFIWNDSSKKYTDLIEAFNNKEIDNNIKVNGEDTLIENVNKEDLKNGHANNSVNCKD